LPSCGLRAGGFENFDLPGGAKQIAWADKRGSGKPEYVSLNPQMPADPIEQF